MSRRAPSVRYDESEIYQDEIKRLMEEEGLSEKEATRQVENDEDLNTFEWNSVRDIITDWVREMCPSGFWYATGEGMGWMKRSGHKHFSARNGAELLRNILPDTDCTFTATKYSRYIEIVNSHHDAMGEVYKIYPRKSRGPE